MHGRGRASVVTWWSAEWLRADREAGGRQRCENQQRSWRCCGPHRSRVRTTGGVPRVCADRKSERSAVLLCDAAPCVGAGGTSENTNGLIRQQLPKGHDSEAMQCDRRPTQPPPRKDMHTKPLMKLKPSQPAMKRASAEEAPAADKAASETATGTGGIRAWAYVTAKLIVPAGRPMVAVGLSPRSPRWWGACRGATLEGRRQRRGFKRRSATRVARPRRIRRLKPTATLKRPPWDAAWKGSVGDTVNGELAVPIQNTRVTWAR